MNLKEMDVKELKALAYDQMMIIDGCQKNLQYINAEISSRKPKENENKNP